MVESKTTEEIHDMGVNLASNGMMKELKELCDKRWLPLEETREILHELFQQEYDRLWNTKGGVQIGITPTAMHIILADVFGPAKPSVRDNSNLRMRPTPSVGRKRATTKKRGR